MTSAPKADADLKRITAYTPRMRSGSGVKAGGCGAERMPKFFHTNIRNDLRKFSVFLTLIFAHRIDYRLMRFLRKIALSLESHLFILCDLGFITNND